MKKVCMILIISMLVLGLVGAVSGKQTIGGEDTGDEEEVKSGKVIGGGEQETPEDPDGDITDDEGNIPPGQGGSVETGGNSEDSSGSNGENGNAADGTPPSPEFSSFGVAAVGALGALSYFYIRRKKK